MRIVFLIALLILVPKGYAWIEGGGDVTCNTITCVLDDDTGYFFNRLQFNDTVGFADLVDDGDANMSHIPFIDDVYELGNSSNRWTSIRIGTGNSQIDGPLILNNINNTHYFYDYGMRIESRTGGDDLYILDDNGAATIDVVGNGTGQSTVSGIKLRDELNNIDWWFQNRQNSDNNFWIQSYNGSVWRTPVKINRSAPTDLLYLSGDDHIGINTLTPNSNLDIYDDDSDGTILRLHSVNSNSGAQPVIKFARGGDNGENITNGRTIGKLRFEGVINASEAGDLIRMAVIRAVYTGDGASRKAELQFETSDGGVPTDRIVITSEGDVGIGTGTPSKKLEVYDGVIQATDNTTGDYKGVRIYNEFGKDNDENGTTQLYFLLSGDDATARNAGMIRVGKENDYANAGNRDSFMELQTANGGALVNAIYIDSSQRVGIGTDTLNDLLHVYGDVQISGYNGNDSIFDVTGVSNNARVIELMPIYNGTSNGAAGFSINPLMSPQANQGTMYGTINLCRLRDTNYNVSTYYANFYRADTQTTYTGNLTNTYGVHVANPSQTGSVTLNNYGMRIARQTTGTANNYGLYLQGGTTASLYVQADPVILRDDVKLTLGTGSDSTMYYDGSDLYIDSQESGSGDLLINSNGGNVGIGTSAPEQELDVRGDILLKNGGDGSRDIMFDSARNAENEAVGAITNKWNGTVMSKIKFLTGADSVDQNNGRITIETYDAGVAKEAMRIDEKQRIGIGEINPQALLHINSSLNNNSFRIDRSEGGTPIFLVNSSSMASGGDGFIGINTGDRYMRGFSKGVSAHIRSVFFMLSRDSADPHFYYQYDGVPNVGTTLGRFFFVAKNSSNEHIGYAGFQGFAVDNSTNDEKGGLSFRFNFGGDDITPWNLQEGARMQPDGDDLYFGIGTSSPDEIIHVKGATAASIEIESGSSNKDTNLRLNGDREWLIQNDGDGSLGDADSFHIRDSTAGVSRFVIDDSGNVGISNPTPANRLHVNHTTAGMIGMTNTDASYTWRIGIDDDGDFSIRDSNLGVNPIAIENGADENSIYINSDSFVGINNDRPVRALDVFSGQQDFVAAFNSSDSSAYIQIRDNKNVLQIGTTALIGYLKYNDATLINLQTHNVTINDGSGDRDFRIESDDDTYMFFVDGGNNKIGISTDTPTSELHVDGDVNVTGMLHVQNDCGIPGTMLVGERGTIVSNQFVAYGNGQAGWGVAQACSGTIVAVTAQCNSADGSNHVSFSPYVESTDTLCNTGEVNVANQAFMVTNCTATFNQGDSVGCRTKTETGAVTICTCAMYLRYD